MIVTLDLKVRLRVLIEYNWKDELEDYQDNCGDLPGENQRDGHIFETLVFLDNFVEGRKADPRDYLETGKGDK